MADVRIDSTPSVKTAFSPEPSAAPAMPTAATPVVPFGPRRVLSAVGASLESAFAVLRPSWQRYHYEAPRTSPSTPPRRETPVQTADPALAGLTYSANADIHYDGDFVVPGSGHVAAHLTDVLAEPNWQQLVRDHLSYGTAKPGDPLRIYISGLNADITDNDHRGQVVARELSYQFAELDNATSSDITIKYPGGAYTMETRTREWTMAALQRMHYHFPSGDHYTKDGVAAALADLSDPNQRIIDNTQRLLLAYIDSDDKTPLELWGYSEGTLVTYLAIKSLEDRYLSERMKGVPATQRAAKLAELKQRFDERCSNISAMFVGSAVDHWNAPIRRIDFFATADNVVRYAGPARKVEWYRKLNDALTPGSPHDAEINYPQPFDGLDAHNMFASGAPALSLYMEMNQVRTVRGLYDKWQAGTMVAPTLEQVKTRIREQKATDELWAPEVNLPRVQPTPGAT